MKSEIQLTQRQQLILTGVLRDVRRVLRRAVNHRKVNSSAALEGTVRTRRWQRDRESRRARAARAGLVVVNLWRWLGRSPSGSDRVLVHRDLLRLEAMGLLKRQADRSGRRTTHVKLTAPGHQIARRLLAQQDALADDEAFDVEDFSMLPLDWPMEAQNEPGEVAAPTSLSDVPPAADVAVASPPVNVSPPDVPPTAACATVGSFPSYGTQFAGHADA